MYIVWSINENCASALQPSLGKKLSDYSHTYDFTSGYLCNHECNFKQYSFMDPITTAIAIMVVLYAANAFFSLINLWGPGHLATERPYII